MSEEKYTKDTTKIKQDRRILRTRRMIQDAFLELMHSKEYESITITDISAQAGINRKTFYAHFESKEQLFFQMMQDMFYDLFSTFMYEKAKPESNLDRDILHKDIVSYLKKVDKYQEELNIMITGQTSWLAFETADQVIQDCMEKIHVMSGRETGLVPAELLIFRIRNFFLTSIDWWLEQKEYTAEEAAVFFGRMMRKSVTNIFRYQQMQSSGRKRAEEESGVQE